MATIEEEPRNVSWVRLQGEGAEIQDENLGQSSGTSAPVQLAGPDRSSLERFVSRSQGQGPVTGGCGYKEMDALSLWGMDFLLP